MMGAAVMCARGMVPGNIIEAALTLPYRLRMPLMPAQGLYLQDAGLGFVGIKVNANDYYICRVCRVEEASCVMEIERKWLIICSPSCLPFCYCMIFSTFFAALSFLFLLMLLIYEHFCFAVFCISCSMSP